MRNEVQGVRKGGPAVELASLTRRFGRRWALRGVTASVPRGEVVALVGPNGSGKTTLLRILATLLRPTSGTASVLGLDLCRRAAAVREVIGMLGHAPGLYPDLTALENLAFVQRMAGSVGGRGALDEALDAVGLTAEADERVRGFSMGMQRRLALARLMLRPAELLLLDEPYASLDSDGTARLNAFLEAAKRRGCAVLVATHDTSRADGLLDRTLGLRAGRLVLDAPVRHEPSGPDPAGDAALVSAVRYGDL